MYVIQHHLSNGKLRVSNYSSGNGRVRGHGIFRRFSLQKAQRSSISCASKFATLFFRNFSSWKIFVISILIAFCSSCLGCIESSSSCSFVNCCGLYSAILVRNYSKVHTIYLNARINVIFPALCQTAVCVSSCCRFYMQTFAQPRTTPRGLPSLD